MVSHGIHKRAVLVTQIPVETSHQLQCTLSMEIPPKLLAGKADTPGWISEQTVSLLACQAHIIKDSGQSPQNPLKDLKSVKMQIPKLQVRSSGSPSSLL